MNTNTFFKLEIKNLFSNRTQLFAFFCVLLAGAYAVFHGGSTIAKQREVIAELPAIQAESSERLLGYKKDAEAADALYYLTFNTFDPPSDWAAFSVGQRDVNPYNVKVRMLAIEGQIYDSEMTNPTNLLFGNFDLSFVLVFLFPLLIIALTHNLISAEQESGTWNLLRSQPVSTLKITVLRLLLRFAAVFAFAFLMIVFACFALGADCDARFAAASFLTLVYFAFWFAVVWLVISFGRGSNFNALSLIGIWIFLVLLAPALLASIVSSLYPISEAMETTIAQREGYHEKWDQSKRATMEKFYARYPQFREFTIPEDKFSWGWYYAMQQMGDEDSAETSARYRKKLEQRDQFTNRVALFLPAVGTQLEFNRIAGTDLDNHLTYLDSVRNYHETIRERYYPFIFRNATVTEANLQNPPEYLYQPKTFTQIFSLQFFALLIISVIFFVIGANQMRRVNESL